jgi:hypothetical protein
MAANRKTQRRKTEAIQNRKMLDATDVGLSDAMYRDAIKYLFDRAEVSPTIGAEWYWNIEEPKFNATAREWVLIQTVLFSRVGVDLAPFSNEQVGMGLNYIMDSGIGRPASCIFDESVSKDERLALLTHLPTLWRDCIGARLNDVLAPIGSVTHGRLGYVCYMWFDVWSPAYISQSDENWSKAFWAMLKEILASNVREVQIAALHGIGHCAVGFGFDREVEEAVRAFWLNLKDTDEELKSYAKAAAKGMVQ